MRVVNVVGAGGVGKTTISAAIAVDLARLLSAIDGLPGPDLLAPDVVPDAGDAGPDLGDLGAQVAVVDGRPKNEK